MYQVFSALGDPTRFGIVERLLAEGELNAGQLLDGISVSGPAVSRHLKVLRNAGIVTQRVDAQRRVYAIAPDAIAAIHAWTIDHRTFWEGSIDRLAPALGEKDDRFGD